MDQGYTSIIKDESMRETASHGSAEFPFAYYLEDVYQFDLHCMDWHWHPELEWVYVQRGSMEVLIGADKFTLTAPAALLINTRVIHRFEASGSAVIPNIVFSPELLSAKDSLLYQKYVYPILHASASYWIQTPAADWQQEVLDGLNGIFALQRQPEGNELLTVRLLIGLWDTLCRNTTPAPAAQSEAGAAGSQARVQIMMRYIQENYRRPITLDEIATAVSVSKSGALKLFAHFLNTSPIAYLIRYRLQRAANLLAATEKTVADIAQDTGFHDAAYFCRTFKKLYGVTPTEYRNTRR